MKVLVLGGFGFIGSHITKKLSKEGYEAIPASRKNGVDLFDYKNFKNYLYDLKPDSIINCAANVGSVNFVSEFSADVIFSNVQILINLYKAISESCPKTKLSIHYQIAHILVKATFKKKSIGFLEMFTIRFFHMAIQKEFYI